MHLAGQHERRARPDAGYAMAVLLAGIAVMGIVWTLVMPVWKQAVQREKEAELIFRAGQYARAVALYQRKYANAFPPSVDVLLREKFLRKKYKDPVTNGEFRYLSPLDLQAQPGLTMTTSTRPGLPTPGGGASPGPASSPGAGGAPGRGPSAFGGAGGGIGGPNTLGPGRPGRRSIGWHCGSGEQELRGVHQGLQESAAVQPMDRDGPGRDAAQRRRYAAAWPTARAAGTRRAGPVLRSDDHDPGHADAPDPVIDVAGAARRLLV